LRHAPAHLIEERRGGDGISAHEVTRELNVDREGDQVLLRTVVEVALDAPPVGVGGDCEPPARRAQLGDLALEPVERLPQRLDGRRLQADRP
jgi:hypothetical protein